MPRALRLLVAALGGYAFAAGLVALVATASPHMGMAPTESATLGGMLGIGVFLAILIWLVASTRPVRATLVVLAASALMIGTAPLLAAG